MSNGNTAYNLALAPSGGNVGIGTTSPNSTLVVAGNVHIGSTNPNVASPSNGLLVDGNVGIGWTSPASNLDIYNPTSASGVDIFRIITNVTSAGNVKFRVNSDGDIYTDTAVGSPANVAENYPVDDSLIEAGEVLSQTDRVQEVTNYSVTNPGQVIDKQSLSVLTRSSVPYDDKLIGIVSTKPAVLMGAGIEGKPIALTGRVPTKVSTENGPIQVGDYLTSSSTPGVAMKATRPGPTVGKALESFAADATTPGVENCAYTPGVYCGKILVFVNVGFADPGNFLASLSLDPNGNLLVPKIKVDKLLISDNIGLSTTNPASLLSYEITQPASNTSEVSFGSSEVSTNVLASLKNLDQAVLDLSQKQSTASSDIADLKDRIASLSAVIASAAKQSSTSSGEIATGSSTLRNDVASLNLTPPDILYATGSATLATPGVGLDSPGVFSVSEATVSGMLTAYQAQIQDHFKVLGKTTLGNTLIAGDFTVDGTLTISGNSINSLGYTPGVEKCAYTPGVGCPGILYLQNSPLAQGLDIFSGKVTIDSSGNVKTQGEIAGASIITNKLTISNTPIASSSATLTPTIGSSTIPIGQTKVTVNTTQVSDTAKVFITPTTPTDKVLSVTNIKKGESFDVSTLTAPTTDINFNWWIIQTE